ncbi:MAG: hypothetical protein NC038_07780 [Paludibacter sp.]|nr:hypothetical protein [Prevotella sp.]MCM1443642.1 hypothetical protein [Muribaculum sp.]MCM1482517.1 hypothetical protein [Paludibacter sp.]MCM1576893.1 hypothetical protein [Bacteroides sp.]
MATKIRDKEDIAIAYIDLSTEEGIRIAQDLEQNHRKSVEVDFPLPPGIAGCRTYTLDEAIEMSEQWLNEHYGTNLKLKRYGI